MAYIRSASQLDITNGTSTDLAVSPKNLYDNVWFLDGSTLSAIKKFGTINNFEIPFIQNNVEMMRLTATGLGIGLINPQVKLEVDSGTNGISGIRMTKLTSSSSAVAGAPIGVDSSGNIVRITVTTEAIQSFTLSGDTGTPQTITNLDTVSILGGTGINTVAASPDKITINLDAAFTDLSDVTITAPLAGQVVVYSGSTWVNTTFNLNDLGDVNTSSASPGQVLQFSGGSWVPATVGGSAFNVAATGGSSQVISSGDTLTIAQGTGITTTASATDTVTIALNANLDNLTDVVITSVVHNQVLQYQSGSASWVNSSIVLSELSDVNTTGATTNQILQYNGLTWVPATISTTFTLAASSGTNQTISSGDTLTIAQGTGITTTASATDTVTIALDASLTNLTDVAITGPTGGQVLQYTGSEWVNASIGAGTVSSVNVTDTADIDLTVTGSTTTPMLWADLTTTGVGTGSYGSASSVATFTVNNKGRLSAAATTSIAIAASQVTSGTFANGLIAVGNVTQHQASLSILETQIVDGALLARVNDNETINGTWTFTGNVNVPLAPVNPSHATSKQYVDNLLTGLDWKNSVRLASTANVTVTYNATAGVSARGQITGAPNTLDSVSLASGDRILLKDQSTGAQNGIWVVTTVGTGANGIWDRATDFDNDAEVTANAAMFVSAGTINGDSAWVLTTNDPIVIGGAGGTALTFVQFSGAGQITAGDGLTKSGNTLHVVTANSGRIVVNPDTIDLASGIVAATTWGSASQVPVFTTDTYGRVTGVTGTTITFGIDQLSDVATSGATNGQILQFNGANWVPINYAISGTTNGLQAISGNVGLGGTMTQNTTIAMSNFNLNFDITGTGKVGIDTTPISGFDVNTSVSCGAIRTVTTDTTVNDTDYMVLVNNSINVVITLPSAASTTRREYVIKKVSSNTATVTIDPNSAELIDGASTYVIGSSYVSIKLKSDGTSWYIF